tara:strand:+ start:7648 stop:8634 length:987 start_codon:yes stop_codon:yes gene_type:complete
MLEERRTRGGHLTPGAQSRRAPMPGPKNKSKRDLLRKQKAARKLKMQQRPETDLAVRDKNELAVRDKNELAVRDKNELAVRNKNELARRETIRTGDDETKKKAATSELQRARGQQEDLPRSGKGEDPGIKDKGSFLSRIYKSSMRDQGLDPAHRRFKSKYAWNKRANSQEMLRKSKDLGDRVDRENAEFQAKNPNQRDRSQRDWRSPGTPVWKDKVPDTESEWENVGNARRKRQQQPFRSKAPGNTEEAKVDTNTTSKRAEPTPNKDTKEPITPTILGGSEENKGPAATGAAAENQNALNLTGKSHRQLADDANKRKMNRKIVNNNTN